MAQFTDTIAALSTPPGSGALGVIRLSGSNAFEITNDLLKKKIDFESENISHSLHFRKIYTAENELLDEALISVFKAPHGFTGEDAVEISVHGSHYIIAQLLKELTRKQKARLAMPGEFTQRAFLNGKMDLSEAEAVADLIASESKAAHSIALKQMRGGYSAELRELREQLIHLTALIELELDFGEEDVEFADRGELNALLNRIESKLKHLHNSFSLGNAIKNGVPVVIAGKPNAGKSTLLNSLLNEERAIVSNIEGTTRDTVEEVLNIDGIKFRLIDTAGLREETRDEIEKIGIQRTLKAIENSSVLIYLFDAFGAAPSEVRQKVKELYAPSYALVLVANKTDLLNEAMKEIWAVELRQLEEEGVGFEFVEISAKEGTNIEKLKAVLKATVNTGALESSESIVSNVRHFEALAESLEYLSKARASMQAGLSGDMVAADLRNILRSVGSITGEVDYDRDILGTIFSKFCIGK